MAYTDPGYTVERVLPIPSVALSAAATPYIYKFGNKIELTGISAFVTTSTGVTPVVQAFAGTVAIATVTVVGAALTTVAGAVVSDNSVAADEDLTVAVTGVADGVATITLKYRDKF
jgi:Zn-dependent alcohol dehydrogenase